MRISDWSSYVCSSDLIPQIRPYRHHLGRDTGIAQALRYPFTQCLTGTRQQAQLTADLRHAEHALHVDQRRLRQSRLPAAHAQHSAVELRRQLLGHAIGHQYATVENGEAMTALGLRSEEHTSELPSLMRISYADFCLKKKKLTAN